MKTNKHGMIEAGETIEEAKANALQASIDNPGKYVTVYACFGAFLSIADRLNVNAPGDAVWGVYWLNGKEKPFTESQIIADQNATPLMS